MYLLNGQYSQSATTTHIAKYENQEKQLWFFCASKSCKFKYSFFCTQCTTYFLCVFICCNMNIIANIGKYKSYSWKTPVHVIIICAIQSSFKMLGYRDKVKLHLLSGLFVLSDLCSLKRKSMFNTRENLIYLPYLIMNLLNNFVLNLLVHS